MLPFILQFIKDYHLFGVVGVLLLVDCIILVPWTIFFPMQTRRLTAMENVTFICTYIYLSYTSFAYIVLFQCDVTWSYISYESPAKDCLMTKGEHLYIDYFGILE